MNAQIQGKKKQQLISDSTMLELLWVTISVASIHFEICLGKCHVPDTSWITCDADLTRDGVLLVRCQTPGDITHAVVACDSAMFVNGFLSKTFNFFNVSTSGRLFGKSGDIFSYVREVYPSEIGEYVFEVSITFKTDSNCEENKTNNAILKVRTNSITITKVPTITIKHQDDILLCTDNRTITFQCTAKWFFVPPRVLWFMGGFDITKNNPGMTTIITKSPSPYYEVISLIHVTLLSSDNLSVIRCQNSDPADSGNPTLYDTLTLTILDIPKVGPPLLMVKSAVYDEPSFKLFEGETVTFACSVQGQEQGILVMFSCYDKNEKSSLVTVTSERDITFTLIGNQTYHRATCVCTGQHASGCYNLVKNVTLLVVTEKYTPFLTQDDCPRLRPVFKDIYGVSLGFSKRIVDDQNVTLECSSGSRHGQVTSVGVSCEDPTGTVWLLTKNKTSSLGFSFRSDPAVDRSVCTCAMNYSNDFCVATSSIVLHLIRKSHASEAGLIQMPLHYVIVGAISCFLLPLILGLFIYIAKNWTRLYTYYYVYGGEKHYYEHVQATSVTSLDQNMCAGGSYHIYSEVREIPS